MFYVAGFAAGGGSGHGGGDGGGGCCWSRRGGDVDFLKLGVADVCGRGEVGEVACSQDRAFDRWVEIPLVGCHGEVGDGALAGFRDVGHGQFGYCFFKLEI